MRASFQRAIFFCLVFVAGCETAEDASTRSQNAKGSLTIEIVSAYQPLSTCMRSFLETDRDSLLGLRERAYAFSQKESNFAWFESQASLIIDLDGLPAETDRRAYAENIQMALAKFAADDPDKSNNARVLRAKAVALSMIYLSGGTGGKCRPSVQLFQWM